MHHSMHWVGLSMEASRYKRIGPHFPPMLTAGTTDDELEGDPEWWLYSSVASESISVSLSSMISIGSMIASVLDVLGLAAGTRLNKTIEVRSYIYW